MEELFNFVHYKVVKYQLNRDNGYFEKQPLKVDFSRLPFDLKIEETREQRLISQGAKEMITGRIKNGQRQFFTGLIPMAENFFYGDDFKKSKGEMKKSLCVFQLSTDFKTLVVFYFNNYYIQNREGRVKFVLSFIQSLTE
jgi:hypothetical protein